MKKYLKDVIKDRGLGDLQSTREQISRCFSTVDCFLLPHPGLAVTKKNYSGSIPQIGSFFRGMINRLEIVSQTHKAAIECRHTFGTTF